MARKIFKKRKDNQNKIKPSGRKRKIFATIALALSLLFGKPRLSSSQSSSSNFDTQTIQERVINDRDFEDNDQQVVLVKYEGNSVTPPTNHGPSNFPTPPTPTGGRPSLPVYVPKYRTAPKTVNPGLGAGANPAGAGNDGGTAEFDDQCPVSKEQKSQESITRHHDFTQKSRKKKKRNQHLDQQIEVNGESFEFERYQIEKKTPSHGTDFGLDPDYGPDGKIIQDRKTGKPRAKQNKKNYKKFTDNLSEFVKDQKSEKIEPQYRKGRKNEQDVVGFLNRKDRRFVIFNKHTKKYITGWVMNDLQYQEFRDNNNII